MSRAEKVGHRPVCFTRSVPSDDPAELINRLVSGMSLPEQRELMTTLLDQRSAGWLSDLREQRVVLRTCLHGMDDHLVTAVKEGDREFQQAAAGVEAETELRDGWFFCLGLANKGVLGGVDRILGVYTVLERRVVDMH